MIRHQYGISAFVSQTSFGRETSGDLAKCRLFSQAIIVFEDVLSLSWYVKASTVNSLLTDTSIRWTPGVRPCHFSVILL